MRVTPIDDKTADASGFQPWPAGEYGFEVKDCVEAVSASGNEMIKLTLAIFNPDGASRTVFDYLLSSDKGQWKVRHFMQSVGLLPSYEAGIIDTTEIFERSGRCKVTIRPARDNYAAQNQVLDYLGEPERQTALPVTRQAARPAPVTHQAARPNPAAKAPARDLDDEIPF